MGTRTPFQKIEIETECLPSGFFSIRLTEAIPIMSERGERGVRRLFYTCT